MYNPKERSINLKHLFLEGEKMIGIMASAEVVQRLINNKPQMLRRSFATDLLEAGTDIRYIQI